MSKSSLLFACLRRASFYLFSLEKSKVSVVNSRFLGLFGRPREILNVNILKYWLKNLNPTGKDEKEFFCDPEVINELTLKLSDDVSALGKNLLVHGIMQEISFLQYLFNGLKNMNKLPFPIVLLSLSLWSASDSKPQMPLNEKELDEKTRRDAIAKADDLFTANKHEEVCATLSDFKESGDVEVLWRMARSKYKFSTQQDVKKEDKEAAIIEGYDIICRALEIDNKHSAVHKWMSVLLDARSELRGMKERITQLQKVKEHMLEAVKLNPNDATTYHMLGSWCYQIADMAWYQRKIAATLFASPPTSTFQEALEYFKKAEEVQPNFYSQNLLMLGKTHLKLGEQDRAFYYLNLTTEYLVSSDDDLMAHKEAETLLQKLNYKKS